MLSKEEFARRLKTAIAQKGLRQAELAEMVGTTAANMSNYVREKSFPPVDTLVEIAKKLDVSLDWLCGITTPIVGSNNHKLNTFGELAQIISQLLLENPPFAELSTVEVWDSGYKYDAHAIYFTNGIMNTFLDDLIKMRELLRRKTLDDSFFSRWLEDRIHSLSYIPLSSDIQSIEDWMDTGSLPF